MRRVIPLACRLLNQVLPRHLKVFNDKIYHIQFDLFYCIGYIKYPWNENEIFIVDLYNGVQGLSICGFLEFIGGDIESFKDQIKLLTGINPCPDMYTPN